MTVKEGKKIGIDRFPNFGPNGSVTGMRKLYYGDDALLVKCGAYVYKVDSATYSRAE